MRIADMTAAAWRDLGATAVVAASRTRHRNRAAALFHQLEGPVDTSAPLFVVPRRSAVRWSTVQRSLGLPGFRNVWGSRSAAGRTMDRPAVQLRTFLTARTPFT
jgi:hypothetical protein